MASLAEGDTLTAPLETEITLTVNEHAERLTVDNRSTLLNVLRERLGWTGTKKGCDQRQCGYCTPGQRGTAGELTSASLPQHWLRRPLSPG